MQEQSIPAISSETREAVRTFLDAVAMAPELADVNIAAGIALQKLGELAPDLG